MEMSTIIPTTVVNWTMNMTGNDIDDDPVVAALKLATQVINILILVFLMISMGCTFDFKDLKDTFRHPAGFFVGMLSQFVLMPLIAFCLGLAFNLEAAGALSVLILACCPGGTLSNLFTYWTNGDVCLSVCMTSVSTAVAIGMMPLNLFIYSRVWTDEKSVIPYVGIVTTLASILIPVAFGVFMRWWRKEWTKFITRVGMVMAFICIITVIVLFTLLNPYIFEAGWQLWICAMSLPFLGFFLGYGLAFLFRQPHKKCRTIAFETGSQNVSLASTLIVLSFSNSPLFYDMLFFPSLYGCFIYIDSFLVIAIYKLVAYLQKKHKSPMDKEHEGNDDDDVKIGYDNGIVATDEKEGVKTVTMKQTAANEYIQSDEEKFRNI